MKRFYILAIVLSVFMVTADVSDLMAQKGRVSHVQKTTSSKRRGSVSPYPGQFPESSERLLTNRDVEHQTAWGMKVMMNEIYARHHYVFREKELRKHFAREKWYRGREHNMKNIKLSDIEIQNIAF